MRQRTSTHANWMRASQLAGPLAQRVRSTYKIPTNTCRFGQGRSDHRAFRLIRRQQVFNQQPQMVRHTPKCVITHATFLGTTVGSTPPFSPRSVFSFKPAIGRFTDRILVAHFKTSPNLLQSRQQSVPASSFVGATVEHVESVHPRSDTLLRQGQHFLSLSDLR
jgi:hypothetical protein